MMKPKYFKLIVSKLILGKLADYSMSASSTLIDSETGGVKIGQLSIRLDLPQITGLSVILSG